MTSAFGIEHVSKAYTNLVPKLSRTLRMDTATRAHGTLDQKLRKHAVNFRDSAGVPGKFGSPANLTPSTLAGARERKVAAHGIYSALSRNNRKTKVLP